MTAPNFRDAFADSLVILWKLFLMIICLLALLYAAALKVSPAFAMALGVVFFVGMPAILMVFSHTSSVLSLNPASFVPVMTRVGILSIVLVIFLFIMFTSIQVVNAFIGDDFAALSTIMQSSVGNHYAIVAFHLMGYMLYQYQDRLKLCQPR